MGIINNQGVFIAPPLGEASITSFREDDDFSTELFDESVVLPSLPNNIGIAFIKSSDSPADYATIALNGTNTSTIFIDNTVGICSCVVSGDFFVGYGQSANLNTIKNSFVNYVPSVDPGDVFINGRLYVEQGIAAAGLNGQIQYNNNGSLDGTSQLYYDDINHRVGIGTSIPTAKLHVNGSLVVSGVSTFGPIYQESKGKIAGPGNLLNSPSNALISIDLSQSMVSIGTIGREPIWNLTNVPLTTSRMATVTIVGIASGSSVAMGRTYTINGGSNKGITWATTSVPNFDTTNWSILTFRVINDDVGVSSVFATKN